MGFRLSKYTQHAVFMSSLLTNDRQREITCGGRGVDETRQEDVVPVRHALQKKTDEVQRRSWTCQVSPSYH
jgi:hypothetical protein